MILEKILERLASAAPFFRFMVDHLLCPEMEGHGKLWKKKMANCGYPNASMYIR